MNAAGEKPDDEFDALPLDTIEPFPLPLRFRPDNPEYRASWRLFDGYAHDDASDAHVHELLQTKQGVVSFFF